MGSVWRPNCTSSPLSRISFTLLRYHPINSRDDDSCFMEGTVCVCVCWCLSLPHDHHRQVEWARDFKDWCPIDVKVKMVSLNILISKVQSPVDILYDRYPVAPRSTVLYLIMGHLLIRSEDEVDRSMIDWIVSPVRGFALTPPHQLIFTHSILDLFINISSGDMDCTEIHTVPFWTSSRRYKLSVSHQQTGETDVMFCHENDKKPRRNR